MAAPRGKSSKGRRDEGGLGATGGRGGVDSRATRKWSLMASSIGSRERRSNLFGLEGFEDRRTTRELHGVTHADRLAEKVHVAPDVDLRRAHEERGELPRVLSKWALGELASHAVHAALGLEPEEIVASRGRELFEEGAHRRRLEVGTPGKDARDDPVLRGVDDDALPRLHFAGTHRERSEDGDIEGHGERLSTTAFVRRAPEGRRLRTVGLARTVWGGPAQFFVVRRLRAPASCRELVHSRYAVHWPSP